MTNEEHLEILKQGVETWNRWRKENPEVRPDLSGADLSGAKLMEADFSGARLWKADLSRTNLWKANLSYAILSETNLRWAYLVEADFRRAILENSDLSWADVTGGDFTEAMIEWSTFGCVNLSAVAVKGLDTVFHLGPSIIDISTIYVSKGNIPEVFLRGAGVPDTFITQIPSLVEQATRFYSCFISHSSKDKRFCDRLYADFRAKDVQAYYFPKNARWGETVWGEIDRSIEDYDKVVVICSENSLQSGPVLREIERALQREDREGKNILLPIRIDDYIFDRWEHPRKADVVSKVVGDFRGWDQDAAKYDAAFKTLLKMLKTEGSD
jgi:hypothetical protein